MQPLPISRPPRHASPPPSSLPPPSLLQPSNLPLSSLLPPSSSLIPPSSNPTTSPSSPGSPTKKSLFTLKKFFFKPNLDNSKGIFFRKESRPSSTGRSRERREEEEVGRDKVLLREGKKEDIDKVPLIFFFLY